MIDDIVEKKGDIKRIKTYIKGLDENMESGIPERHVTLISGAAGTMKSSVCFNILFNEALKGVNGLYISLEQSYWSLLNNMVNMGMDLKKINILIIKDLSTLKAQLNKLNNTKGGTIIIVDVGCIRKEITDLTTSDNRSWLNVIKNIVKRINQESACPLFVLDSLSALYVLSRFENPRIEIFYLFEFMRDLKMTSFLISEVPPEHSQYSQYGIEEFLSDGIIQLRLTPFRRNIVREISVIKMRATACNNDVFSLEIKDGEFHALYGGQNPLL
jgi:KaiC/GvpD/RAD55 family RecA-like ATPase